MRKFILAICCFCIFSGCSVFKKNEKYGCPTNGKNVGAEKILGGDKDAMKAAKKAKKFNS